MHANPSETGADDARAISRCARSPRMKVELTPEGKWVRSVALQTAGSQVRPRALEDRQIELADYEFLAKLNHLESVSVFHSNVTLAELNKLREFPSLKSLILAPYLSGEPSEICNHDGHLTDDALRTIGTLTNLETLNLTSCGVADEQVKVARAAQTTQKTVDRGRTSR